MFLKQLSIKARLTYAFILIGLIFLAFGLFAIKEMNRLSNLTTDLHHHPFQVSNAALKARSHVIMIDRSMKDMLLETSDLGKAATISAIDESEQTVYRQLDIIRKNILGDDGLLLEKETRRFFTKWKSLRDDIIQQVKEGRKNNVSTLTRKKETDHVDVLDQKFIEINNYATSKADNFMRTAKELDGIIVAKTAITVVVVLLISAFLAYILIDSIVSDVLRLKIIMAKIGKTGKLEKSNLTGKNEVISMAKHFNFLIDMLQDQIYLRDGISDMIRELSGNLPYHELVSKGLGYIARYTDSCTGALYSYDHRNQVCELKSTYAFINRNYLSESFKTGEGIIGQVAVERKPIHLHGISRADAVGNTGTVSEPPKSIYAVPLIFDDMLYGVLEVGSFETFSRPQIDFMNAAAINLSSYLFSSVQNEEIQRLLKESREVNESLQARTDEVNEANEKLTAMNEELQAQSRELQAQTEELEVQKTELEIQRSRVEEADRLKSEFLSNMSHELRTPLNSVLALSQLMISKGTGENPEKESDYLKVIERNGRQLLALINDILDLSKIEAGKMDIYMTDFETSDLVDRALSTIIPIAETKGLEIIRKLETAPRIHSDEDKINQILLNLFSNAVKFTEQGRITIEVKSDYQNVYFAVSDTGIGIARENLFHIFDEFRQVDGSTTRSHEGTGLGLAICGKLASLLGGEIEVDSDTGKGSTFTLSLPLRKPEDNEPRKKQLTENKKIAGRTPTHLNTVVVIDDDPDIRAELKTYLTGAGYHVETARNGRLGVELVRSLKPVAVTLDIMMPEMDGWEVIRLLKENRETDQIPIIIVSVADDQQTGMALGAAGYLSKPVSRDRILKAIQSISKGTPDKHIAVVDDDPVVGDLLKEVLEDKGYRIDVYTNSPNALTGITAAPPDVIILDLIMPDMDGFTLYKKLKEQKSTEDIPVVILTSKAITDEDKLKFDNSIQHIINKGEMKMSELMPVLLKEISAAGSNSPESTEPGNPNEILVVEDNEVASLQIRLILEENGYEVRVAADGSAALETIRRTRPRAVVLDLMMPGIDGFQVLDSLRADPKTRDLPILVLSAKELTTEDRERLSANRVEQLIRKGSIDRNQLLGCIEALLTTDSEKQERKETPRPVPHRDPNRPKKDRSDVKILVVEDNPDNLLTINALLTDAGYHHFVAQDGYEALSVATSVRPDIILMDMQLPGMSGLEVTAKLKQDSEMDKTPVVALTAKAMRGDREEIIAAGCDDYISKPIDPETLIEKIEHWT